MGNKRDQTSFSPLQSVLARQITSQRSVTNAQLIKLIIQYLGSLGSPQLAQLGGELSDETGISVDDSATARLSRLLTQPEVYDLEQEPVLAEVVRTVESMGGTNLSAEIRKCVYKRLFLEAKFLEGDDQRKAVRVLRLVNGLDEVLTAQLSSLLLYSEQDHTKLAALHWEKDCDLARSRQMLVEEVMDLVPFRDTPDTDRLVTLVDQAMQFQRMTNPYYMPPLQGSHEADITLYKDYRRTFSARDRLAGLPLKLKHSLRHHTNEVWFVRYSPDGRYLASASSDQTIVVYNTADYSVHKILKGHKGNIMYVAWAPDGRQLLSTSFDQTIKVWDLCSDAVSTIRSKSLFETNMRVWSLEFIGNNILIGSPDRELAIFDRDGYMVHDFASDNRVSDLAVTADSKLFAVTNTSLLLGFDLADDAYPQLCRIRLAKKAASITTDRTDPSHVLITLLPDELQLWNIADPRHPHIENRFYGMEQSDYILRSCLSDRNLVFSGSEHGAVYVWNREFGNLITTLPGHTKLVNCIDWRPNKEAARESCEWASCSDDGTVRIWGFK